MLRATLRSLLARKLRLMLSGVAVVLGVAFVSGTFVLTDSLGKVFDTLFATVNAGTSVEVRATRSFGSGGPNGDVPPEPVPEAVLSAVRSVTGVAEVVGDVQGFAQVVGRDGRPLTTGGAPSLGVSMVAGSRLEPLVVKQGSAPATDEQVAVDAVTARRARLRPGDSVKVLLKGPAHTFTVSGVVSFGTSDNLAGASLVAFSLQGAQRWVGTSGSYTAVAVGAASGVSDTVLQARVSSVLPAGFEALSAAQKTAEATRQVKQGLGIFSTALLVFAGISLFVGAFLIFNTFTMLIAQRTRELALLRALGASRRQVTGSVLVEALLVGVVSSALGLVLGLGLASAMRALLSALGITLPAGPTVIAARTVISAFAVGTVITGLAALVPARRAAAVTPVEAMRDSGPAEDRSLRRRTISGLLLLTAGIAGLAVGLTSGPLAVLGAGAMLAFLGVTTLSPLIARPVVLVLGAPFARLGVPGRLGQGNAARSPRRTSATAAALMVGLALVSAVSTLGASLKESATAIVSSSLGADYILTPSDFQNPLSRAVPAALRGKPGIDAVTAFRRGPVRIATGHGPPGQTEIVGAEPDQLQRVLHLTFSSGDLDALRRGELVVGSDEAASAGLRYGQQVTVTWPATGARSLRVGGIYKTNRLAGRYLVSDTVFDANTTDPRIELVLVKVTAHADLTAARATLDDALAPFPTVKVQDQSQFVASIGARLDSLLNGITGLLALSILIAVLGIVNTLALSVVERVRELGLLRAVGLQRRQLRRMIRVESVLIAVYGALLGITIGTAMGYALVLALHSRGITVFSVPVTRLVVIVLGAALAGVVAAALPARRAARLDVLEAVATA